MNDVKTVDPTEVSTAELHAYLLASVAPRPIAFASTVDGKGRVNLSPFSFFNVFSANPPVMIFSPARRGRDNTTKHTLDNILEVPETVINIVNYPIVQQASLASTEFPDGVNEFLKAGLTEVPSTRVSPPRVGEAPVAFECVVDDVIHLGDQGGAGNLIISRVVLMHIGKRFLDDSGKLDTTKLDLVARMGGNWYCRASGAALFEVPKPLRTIGIGVDLLPERIRRSRVLSGNDLGQLGNAEGLPGPDAIAAAKRDPDVVAILAAHASGSRSRIDALHHLAQERLQGGDASAVLAILMADSAD